MATVDPQERLERAKTSLGKDIKRLEKKIKQAGKEQTDEFGDRGVRVAELHQQLFTAKRQLASLEQDAKAERIYDERAEEWAKQVARMLKQRDSDLLPKVLQVLRERRADADRLKRLSNR